MKKNKAIRGAFSKQRLIAKALLIGALGFSTTLVASGLEETSTARLTSGSMIELILSAGPMVKFVLLLLAFMSVATWAIIVYKAIYFKIKGDHTRRFSDEFWDSHSLSELNTKTKSMPVNPLLAIFRSGYGELVKITQLQSRQESNEQFSREFSGITNIQRAMAKARAESRREMESFVAVLATVGSAAPFIGLFGTVWGIVNAFHNISVVGTATISTVAPGIAEALIATAVGLVAAIPAVMSYNFFVGRVRALDSEIDIFSSDFLNIIERHFFFEKK